MSNIRFTNFARSTLAVGVTSGDTILALAGGGGAAFPALVAGQYFYATLEDAQLNREIVRVTGRTVDSLLVVRGQDNTAARPWTAGASVSLRLNAAAMQDHLTQTTASQTAAANSATTASNAATSATASQTDAANSANTATTQAGIATTQATNAAASAVSANTALNRYTFSTTTAMADPGVGVVRFNNATLASVTALAMGAQTADSGNPNILQLLLNFNASTSPVKGLLRFTQAMNPQNFVAFNVTDVINNTGWVQITAAFVGSAGAIANGASLVMEFHRNGDTGVPHIPSATILGRISAGTGPSEPLTGAQAATVITGAVGQLAGFRNLLINGNFQINQRGYVSGTNVGAANTYTLDRWRVVTSGQNVTFSASGNGHQITAPAGGIEQVIEGINIGGGTYVLNWTGTATATVNGTARAKGESFTLPANTNATVRLIGGTASQVQLEPGTVATPFEHRPIGAELALCQRYYEVGSGASLFSGNTTSGIIYYALIRYAVSKRAIPGTVAFTDFGNSGFAAGVPTLSSNQTDCILASKSSNATVNGGFFQFSWTSSAEL